MIHLGKKMGNGMRAVACTNNPFIKGRVVEAEEFEKVIEKDANSGNRRYCLKCKNRFDKGYKG